MIFRNHFLLIPFSPPISHRYDPYLYPYDVYDVCAYDDGGALQSCPLESVKLSSILPSTT